MPRIDLRHVEGLLGQLAARTAPERLLSPEEAETAQDRIMSAEIPQLQTGRATPRRHRTILLLAVSSAAGVLRACC